MRRRSVLTTLLALAAGCTGASGPGDLSSPAASEPTPTTDTSTDAGRSTESRTAESLSAIPRPVNCTVVDRPPGDYPALPNSLSESSASTFALDYEKAYASGRLDAELDSEFEGFDGTDADVEETTKKGVLVRVRVGLDYTRSEGTATASGSQESKAWYYVTESFAVRARDSGADTVPSRGWETVACAGD